MKFSLLPRIQSVFSRLRSINANEPLSGLSLVIIIFLDIFVLTALFQGLSDQTASFTTPSDVIPYNCQAIAIDTANYDKSQKIDQILSQARNYQYDTYTSYKYTPSAGRHPEYLDPDCLKIENLFDKIRTDTGFYQLLDTRDQINNRRFSVQSTISSLNGSYDTVLLEKIANQPKTDSISPTSAGSIKQDLQKQTEELGRILEEEKANMALIEQNVNLQGIVAFLTPELANNLRSTLARLEFYYPLKRLGVELLFLVPLFLVVWFWNNHSVRRRNGAQTLVSSHLLVVIFIPIFWKICEGIFEIIPKQLLQALMQWLQDLQILMFWYYFLILLAIGVTLGVIYFLQKKIFSRERLIEKRIERGECQFCGKRLKDGDIFCPFCGENQFRKCTKCKEETYRELPLCRKCGKE
ncbi:zinc ribbon domain-containing protein [Candidatus Gracilibacteria bacterium]|nr:zinc ribbon domain-containing protein [Candidatus Gracilibacteria bacterium]PIQ11106.1 MAG: zinc ribbon domain-containing protein [Candidatus Gracilibacteria bacterium CG18_big_fil_WC_8_21_14_2_50_38_16]PIQ41370.1 MAG: zinc ribbon domain-containing protein [Candidatus Gracilibacteria bacterium CG12_big_fil_rev_8_21_14_0_65_38_15]